MRRFFMLAIAATGAALSMLGCNSDDDSSPSTGGKGGSGGSGGAPLAHCVGINAEFTPAEFYAQAQPDKGCSASADLATVCANDLPVIGAMCGGGCLGMGNDAQQAECIAVCINDALTHAKAQPLSEDCMNCYIADIACARDKCLTPCAVNPAGAECAACRVEKGCVEAFYDCSGLPVPSLPNGSGGEGGA
ncbi:MAG TPA: hypothetical protein VFK05_34970 [Polyangiaceae bacterium]|nr:hypothetical protein [Polyangiaceae bacterium]